MLHLWQQDVLIHHTEQRKIKGMLKLWQQDILIQHTECRKMKGMLKLWRQVVLIQHTEDRSKSMIQIEEDWQESNHFFMTWQLSSIFQVKCVYLYLVLGYVST